MELAMRFSSFNIVHLAVGVFLLVALVAVAFALTSSSGHQHKRRAVSNQLRGIHQGLVTYANSNKGWFAGLNRAGQDDGLGVEMRFKKLIEADMFTPEYAVSPSEFKYGEVREWDKQSPFTSAHYSYAMLQVSERGGRREEWKATISSQAIVMSDRNTGTAKDPRSIHNERSDRSWKGQVLWNDNRVDFEDGPVFETRYGEGELNKKDHLFRSADRDDALLIHSGN